jgi:acyl dehydratase
MPNPIRIKALQALREGAQFILTRTFTRKDTTDFGDLTRDYNPVHYDSRWTDLKGFDGLICHGLLVGSMICEFGGQVGWLATGMNFKFLKPVYFKDTITCTITLTRLEAGGRAEAEAVFTNQDAQQVGHALLTGRLPQQPERDLLKQMITEGDPTNKLAGKDYD